MQQRNVELSVVRREMWLLKAFDASTTVDGLTAATVCYFRLRTMTKEGLSDWSAIVSIIVH